MKKFFALVTALVLCISLIPAAFAVDVQDGGCQHMHQITKVDKTYSDPTSSGHTITTNTYPYCTDCKEPIGNVQTTVSQGSHSGDGITYNYHSGSNHIFCKKCSLCKGSYNHVTVACSGNPHVTIILP